jgi:hypothetical protein
MEISSPNLLTIIRDAKSGKWNIPGFQRGFVWNRPKILLLLDSLYWGYPFGNILNWEVPETEGMVTGRSSSGPGQTTWIVDGQQRTTSLCFLTKQKPYWWKDNDDWDDRAAAFKPMVLLDPEREVEFQLENPIRKKSPFWFPVVPFLAELSEVSFEDFMEHVDQKATKLATELAKQKDWQDPDEFVGFQNEVKKRLVRLGSVLLQSVPCQSVNLGPMAVAEVFERVNRAGTRVRETDVVLAWMEANGAGFMKEDFLPFCEDLDESGWSLPPNLLVPTMVAIAGQNPDLRNIPSHFWQDHQRRDLAWGRMKQAIEAVRQHLQNAGVPMGLVPSKNALFPVVVLAAKKPETTREEIVRLFLVATASGRYSSSTASKFREDDNRIQKLPDSESIVEEFVARQAPRFKQADDGPTWALCGDDLKASYSGAGNRFLRLLYFMTVFPRDPKAWFGPKKGLSFTRTDGGGLDSDLATEWHHFFPKAFLKANGITDDRVNWFGNLIVLDSKANRTISSKAPLDYLALDLVAVPPAERDKQFLPPDEALFKMDRFDEFLTARHDLIAAAMNARMREFGLDA